MCGIAGIISPDKCDHGLIEEMTDILSYRGPDGRGFYRDGDLSLGHRRLSIIDLSKEAGQPMFNEDGSIRLVCNGEIYNYRELAEGLIARGHRFKSHCDSEVLLHLYEENGEDCLQHVNGMFAFALWDGRRRKLISAVDRFGKKPFYYALKGDKLAFASELKSLLLFKWVNRDIDFNAIDRYLSLRYVPAPLSIFRSIKKLEQSTMMIYGHDGLTLKRYWKPERYADDISADKCVERFENTFTDAVRLRLQSDVPLGLYLSGGVDSAAVAGLMHKLDGFRKTSYTVSFSGRYDEYARAKEIADFLGYDSNLVSVGEGDFSLMPQIAYHLDEPFGDLLCLPAFLLGKKAKEQLTVVLSGDGADEILGGYLHQRIMMTRQAYSGILGIPGIGVSLSKVVKLFPASLLNRYFDYPDKFGVREKLKLVQALNGIGELGPFYEGVTSCFTCQDKEKACTREFSAKLTCSPIAEEYRKDAQCNRGFSFLSTMSLMDLKYWIPFSVIYRLDKMNMANAVEVRSPFLDFRVVESALNLPDEWKLHGGRNKILLRRLVERIYPVELRPKGKQAFYMPMAVEYAKTYNNWVSSLLTKESVERRGIFCWGYIEGLFELSRRSSMLATRQLTCLVMLELWFKVFVDSEPTRRF